MVTWEVISWREHLPLHLGRAAPKLTSIGGDDTNTATFNSGPRVFLGIPEWLACNAWKVRVVCLMWLNVLIFFGFIVIDFVCFWHWRPKSWCQNELRTKENASTFRGGGTQTQNTPQCNKRLENQRQPTKTTNQGQPSGHQVKDKCLTS